MVGVSISRARNLVRNGRRTPHSTTDTKEEGRGRPKFVLRNGRLVRTKEHQPQAADEAETHAELVLVHEVDPEAALGIGRKIAIAAFIGLLLMPFSIHLGPIRLTPTIFYLVLAFIPAIVTWLFLRPTRLTAPDYLIAGSVIWAGLALAINHGFGAKVEAIGLLTVQMLGSFVLGRALVRDDKSMMFMASCAVLAGCLLAVPAVIESVTGQPVLLQVANMIGPSWPGVDMSPRLGLHRAQASFEHPILFGVFAASLLSLAVYCLPRKTWLRKIGPPGTVIAAFTSLSAGALLTLNIQFGLMIWARIFRKSPNRWRNLGILVALAYFAIDLVSVRTPFHVLVNYATFSSGSAYTRLLIWEFGSAEALRNPFFGIGEGDWQRPGYLGSSIDNFWLVQALRYGMPSCFMLMAAFIIIMFRARRATGPTESRDMLRRGAIFSLLGTCVAIGTVHLWSVAFMWLMFLAGSSVWLGLDRKNGDLTQPGKGQRLASVAK